MAFLTGYESHQYCPVCQEELTTSFSKEFGEDLKIKYKHSVDGMYEVNGYPSPCENNGALLTIDQINKITVPVFDTDFRTMKY